MSGEDATGAAWVMEWQHYNGPRQRRVVTALADVVSVFRDVDAGSQPVLIDICREAGDGPCLSVGAGGVRSVATWQESLDPPYFTSLGNEEAGPEAFSYGGHESEFAPRHLIDKDNALRAVTEFVTTGTRPTAVPWTEV